MTDSAVKQEVGGQKNCTGKTSLYACPGPIFCPAHLALDIM